ncbi:LuxR C-terminal-related transcriptional regulator [Microbacterium sp. H6]
MFISVKTVSVHVSAVLRKLGVSTRTEAALLKKNDQPRTAAEPAVVA